MIVTAETNAIMHYSMMSHLYQNLVVVVALKKKYRKAAEDDHKTFSIITGHSLNVSTVNEAHEN